MTDSRRKLTIPAAAVARKRAARHVDPWVGSADYHTKYAAKRAEAQASANLLGMDHGIEARPMFREWTFFLLPEKHNRYGHETTCEVVHPENLAHTRRGHGYAATRPPSTVGPDYHGGPWVGPERARELSRKWWAAWDDETVRLRAEWWAHVERTLRALLGTGATLKLPRL